MKRNFEIITDSGADMPENYYVERGVDCIRLGFTMNGVNYGGEDGDSIPLKDFYAALRGGAMPTTYQVTCEQAKAHIEKFLKAGKDVLALNFSSALSGTHDGFLVAAKELLKRYPKRKIYVIDSLCACMGQGLLLDYALKKADEGASIEETRDFTEGLKLKIRHQFTVNNLFHLKRGGRVSSLTAIVGSILKIKPVMRVDGKGKLIVTGKAMGRKKALMTVVENMMKTQALEADDPVYIAHADCLDEAEYVKSLILERLPSAKITIGEIGAVIGSHSGDGTLAVFYKGIER